MPWQSAPPLIIIGGAFALTGFALNGIEKLAHGRSRRVQIDEFTFQMDKRDAAIKEQNKIDAKRIISSGLDDKHSIKHVHPH